MKKLHFDSIFTLHAGSEIDKEDEDKYHLYLLLKKRN